MSSLKKKILLVLLFLIVIVIWQTGFFKELSFENLKSQQKYLLQLFFQNELKVGLLFFTLYVLATALSLPGATILTLAAGAIFGWGWGLLIVSFASSIGATLAFLLSRYFLRDLVERKFGDRVKKLNQGVQDNGAYYLFTLRLIPAIPFFVINFGMGLTHMKALTFYLVSQFGMLPGTFLYVNAGTQLGRIQGPSEILSSEVLMSFILLGIFPLLMKKFVSFWRARQIYKNFKKPHSFEYNIVVIGAGSAGLVCSLVASTVKSKVALIEKEKMGGDCLNTGCVPSKALIKCAKVAPICEPGHFSQVMAKVRSAIRKIEPHDSIERYSAMGVDCFKGEASIVSPWEVEVNGRILTTKNIILATGAEPIVPRFAGLQKVNFKTSESIWQLEQLPARLLILGGGSIGCEMAQAFNRLGAKVTIVEQADRLLFKEDQDVSEFIYEKFLKEGIEILLNHRVKGFRGSHTLELDGEKREVVFDECLFALGRRARTNMAGLDLLDLRLTESGTFEHDEFMRTKYPNIYVAGDCAGPYQFTHVASHQAWYASVNALFSPFKSFRADYRVIPRCTFTDPEVARVGLSEKEAREQGVDYEVCRYELDDLDRYIIEDEGLGFIKVLTPPGKDKILGVTIVGARAGDLLAEFTLAMKWNLGLNKILSTIHPYPTFSEGAKYVAGVWKKNHKPERLLKLVEKFHTWRRQKS